MSFYSIEQINLLLSVQIQPALQGQDTTIFTIPNRKSDEPELFIRVNKPPITQYGGEPTIYGKSLRLLYSIQKVRNLVAFLKMYDVKSVTVTEAKAPNLVNQTNTFRFPTDHLKILFDCLPTMTSSQCDEYIAELIKMNSN